MPEAIDHDRLFKELLTTFFIEFVELFLPEVAAYIERDSLVFLDKEVLMGINRRASYNSVATDPAEVLNA